MVGIPGQCTKYLKPLDSIVMNSFNGRSEKHSINEQIMMVNRIRKTDNIL